MTSFKSRDEQEVAGYAEALRLVQESYDKIDLTENNIKYLHQVLLKFSDKDARHLEEYKKHLQHLVRTEKLVLHGKGRGSYYSPFTRGY